MENKWLKERILMDSANRANKDYYETCYKLRACSGCDIGTDTRNIKSECVYYVPCAAFAKQQCKKIEGFPFDCPGRVLVTQAKDTTAINRYLDSCLIRKGGHRSVLKLDRKIGALKRLDVAGEWERLKQKIGGRDTIPEEELLGMEEWNTIIGKIVSFIKTEGA